MNETIAVQVARGAEWLDAVAPGWEHKVDPETLHMGFNCVLDQALGAFLPTYYTKGPSWITQHGFSCQGKCEWIATIEARRAEQRVPVTEVNVETEVVHHG